MFWKQVSKTIQLIGKVFIVPGAITAGFALACGVIIPLASTQVMIAGLLIWLVGLVQEKCLDDLNYERELKRIRKKKSA